MKNTLLPAALLVALLAASCSQLSRNNPYDPSGSKYIGITFKAQFSFPDGTSPKSMAYYGDRVILGSYKDGTGDFILKIEDSGLSQQYGPMPVLPGKFAGLTGVCADPSGNVYAVDSQNYFQVLDSANNYISYYPVAVASGASSIACSGTSLYISSGNAKTVLKYTTGGTLSAGPVSLSVTANGYFTPGKIFTFGNDVFVINAQKKSEIVKLDSSLAFVSVRTMAADIMDAAAAGNCIELLAERVVYRVDSGMNLVLKWGDFGEGPGRVMNGKLIAYRPQNETIYIIDGDAIKVFGK